MAVAGRAERHICSQQPDSRIIPPALGTSVGGTANVAKLVDALDLGSSGATLGSSSLPIRTKHHKERILTVSPQSERSARVARLGSPPSPTGRGNEGEGGGMG
jgi:hypothetical protein